ncbi:MAG: hypothetical protein D6725_04350 [Planctomycetota bacterium]|nr:MAG: hypothetical protein D6725_04350 [Planctomycetota bacterium]
MWLIDRFRNWLTGDRRQTQGQQQNPPTTINERGDREPTRASAEGNGPMSGNSSADPVTEDPVGAPVNASTERHAQGTEGGNAGPVAAEAPSEACSVVTHRHVLESALRQVIEERRNARGPARELRTQLKEVLDSLEDAARIARMSDVVQWLQDDVERFVAQCRSLNERADTLNRRLQRDRVTIAAVGRLRQGKSRFLKELTGLDDGVIPVSNRTACTGTTLVVRSGADSEEAEVLYYDEAELLENVIRPCCEELGIKPPRSVADALNLQVPDTASNDRTGRVRKHLREVIESLRRNRTLLGQQERIPVNSLARYAAIDQSGGHHHLIREIRFGVSVPFVRQPLLEIVDLPGMGDLRPDFAVRMLKTIAERSDLLVIIRMPKQTGDDWDELDSNVADTVAQALESLGMPVGGILPAAVVFAINLLHNGENQQLVEPFEAKARQKFSSVQPINCASRDAVQQFVADMLREATRDGLDVLSRRKLIEDTLAFATELKQWVEQNHKRVKGEVGGARAHDLFQKLKTAIGRCFDPLEREWHPERSGTVKLGDRVVECIEQVYTRMAEQVEAANTQSGDDGASSATSGLVPDNKVLLDWYYAGRGWTGVVEDAMQITRAELSKAFRSHLEEEFGSLLGLIKQQLSENLQSDELFGRLVAESDESVLSTLAERFEEAGASSLAGAVRDLIHRESTLGRDLYYLARQQMTPLDPLIPESVKRVVEFVESKPDEPQERAEAARVALISQAMQTLRMLRWRLLQACEQGDLQWLVFSVVDELWDALRFEEHSEKELHRVVSYFYEVLTGDTTRDAVRMFDDVGKRVEKLLQMVQA